MSLKNIIFFLTFIFNLISNHCFNDNKTYKSLTMYTYLGNKEKQSDVHIFTFVTAMLPSNVPHTLQRYVTTLF